MNTERRRPSPAVLIALLALVLALATPAHAAVQLAKKSVGTAHLKNKAVTTPKIAKKSVTRARLAKNAVNSSRIADGSVQLADLAPGARPRPPRALVPSHSAADTDVMNKDVVFASRQLPAGRWLVSVSGLAHTYRAGVLCYLMVNGTSVNHALVSSEDDNGAAWDSFSFQSVLNLTGARTVQVECNGSGWFMAKVANVRWTAVEVQ